MRKRELLCFRCSKDPCECELPAVDYEELKRDVQRQFHNGFPTDRLTSGYETMWLIRELDKARGNNKKIICTYCGSIKEGSTREETLDIMTNHMEECPKHPIHRVMEAVDTAVGSYRARILAIIDWLRIERCPHNEPFQHMLDIQAQVIQEDLAELDKEIGLDENQVTKAVQPYKDLLERFMKWWDSDTVWDRADTGPIIEEARRLLKM